MNDRSATVPRSGVSRAELITIVLLVALGLAVRVWRMSGVTLDHFDEGVYAFSALGVSDAHEPHVMYPNQEMFSPPLYFGFAGVLARVLSMAPDQALLILSIIFGTLTIAVVWWLGRSGFGAAAGVSAAAIIALSPFHIAFSRSALTDIVFTFWLLCALGALVVAIERSNVRWAVVGGVATGLAWNTKYHGWFALVISGVALIPYIRNLPERATAWKHLVWTWLVACITALLCYLPWLIYLRTRAGGYRGMTQHYLGMLRTAWLHNLVRYGEMLAYFESPASRVAVAAATMLAVAFAARGWIPTRRLLVFLAAVLLASLALGSAGTTLLLSVVAFGFLLRKRMHFRSWVLFGWIAMWVVAAPVYRPYARLILPFAVATAMAAGVGLTAIIERLQRPVPHPAVRLQWAALAMLMVLATSLAFSLPTATQPWPRERGMGAVADSMSRLIAPGSRVIAVREPVPAYYLHRAGRPGFERNGGFDLFDTLSTPAYVITGIYVRRSPELQKALAEHMQHLTPLGAFNVRPYDVRILDDLSPAAARRYRARPDSTFDLRLWRYTP